MVAFGSAAARAACASKRGRASMSQNRIGNGCGLCRSQNAFQRPRAASPEAGGSQLHHGVLYKYFFACQSAARRRNEKNLISPGFSGESARASSVRRSRLQRSTNTRRPLPLLEMNAYRGKLCAARPPRFRGRDEDRVEVAAEEGGRSEETQTKASRASATGPSPDTRTKNRKRGGNDQPTWSLLSLVFRSANAAPTDGTLRCNDFRRTELVVPRTFRPGVPDRTRRGD